jgi:hypothetical protein
VLAKRSEISGRLPQIQGFTEQEFDYDLTRYLQLKPQAQPRRRPYDGKAIFTVPEIKAALALLGVAAAQIDAQADKNIGNQLD